MFSILFFDSSLHLLTKSTLMRKLQLQYGTYFFSFFSPYTYMDAQITKYKHYYLSRVINSLFRSDAQAFLFFSSCPDKSYLP